MGYLYRETDRQAKPVFVSDVIIAQTGSRVKRPPFDFLGRVCYTRWAMQKLTPVDRGSGGCGRHSAVAIEALLPNGAYGKLANDEELGGESSLLELLREMT